MPTAAHLHYRAMLIWLSEKDDSDKAMSYSGLLTEISRILAFQRLCDKRCQLLIE